MKREPIRLEVVYATTPISKGTIRREVAFVQSVDRNPHVAVRARRVNDGSNVGDFFLYRDACAGVLAAVEAIQGKGFGRKTIATVPFTKDRFLSVVIDRSDERPAALFLRLHTEDGAPLGRELLFVNYELDALEAAARDVLAVGSDNGETSNGK